MRSRDRFREKSIYDFETLTHNIVKTASDRQFLTSSSDSACFKDPLIIFLENPTVTSRNSRDLIFFLILLIFHEESDG